jgi:hypothetical protein
MKPLCPSLYPESRRGPDGDEDAAVAAGRFLPERTTARTTAKIEIIELDRCACTNNPKPKAGLSKESSWWLQKVQACLE